MKLFQFLVFIGFVSVLSPAFADSAAEEEAEKLLNAVGMDEVLSQSMAQMLDVQLQQNPALVPYKEVMLEFLGKYMSYESLKPDMIRIYSEAFTASELREINAFYATDVGRKTIEKMPVLMAQGSQIAVARVQENMGELQSMIQAESERIQKLQQ